MQYRFTAEQAAWFIHNQLWNEKVIYHSLQANSCSINNAGTSASQSVLSSDSAFAIEGLAVLANITGNQTWKHLYVCHGNLAVYFLKKRAAIEVLLFLQLNITFGPRTQVSISKVSQQRARCLKAWLIILLDAENAPGPGFYIRALREAWARTPPSEVELRKMIESYIAIQVYFLKSYVYKAKHIHSKTLYEVHPLRLTKDLIIHLRGTTHPRN